MPATTTTVLGAVALAALLAPAALAQPPSEPAGPMWNMKVFAKAPRAGEAPGFNEPGVRAVLFDGPAYQGKPTRVFAWIGFPKLEPGRKAPGMVLVHGGGGTAFADWVRLWTSRGYAAIAMDTC
ncbi:MAG: hypothetical protein NT173_15330, partial [Opitutales bacterium]|nr:hypothetical protein [Opitutales bacterium]